MKSLDLIKDDLSIDDKKVVSAIDFIKTDDEIIENMVAVGILKFENNNDND